LAHCWVPRREVRCGDAVSSSDGGAVVTRLDKVEFAAVLDHAVLDRDSVVIPFYGPMGNGVDCGDGELY